MNEISIRGGGPAMTANARPKREPGSRLSMGFPLTHNFTLLAFSGFVDALRLATDEGDRSRQMNCSWSIVSHDIALPCGFVSRSHFAASFRLKHGHSPCCARSRAKAQGTSAQHESRFSAAGEGVTL